MIRPSPRARPGTSPEPLLAFLVLAGAALLGTAVVTAPGVAVPLSAQALLLLVLSLVVLKAEPDRKTRGWVLKLLGGALVLRFGALILVHFGLEPYFFAPDAWWYETMGERLVAYWSGAGQYPAWLDGNRQFTYSYINGALVFVLGSASVAAAVLNTFLGGWTAVLAYYLAREILGVQAGKLAGVLTAVFPSMVLWSVLNIRDALATFVTILIVWLGVRAYRRVRVWELAVLLGSIWFMTTIRDYMAFLLLVGLLFGLALALRPGRVGATVVVGAVASVLLAFGMERLGIFHTVPLESPLEAATEIREAFQQDATSAYGMGYDTSSLGGALRFLPVGLSFLLMAPFPWAIETSLQAFAVPEVLLWYLLLPVTFWGLWYAFRRGGGPSLLVGGMMMVVMLSYALVEGNFGTAYRHRAQIAPVLFAFTAAGLILFKTQWENRRRPAPKPSPPSSAEPSVSS